jgi:hypothetical protein
MGSKIQVVDGNRVIGALTIFDLVPSFAVIHAVMPEARMIAHDFRHDKWYVDIGDAPAPMLAD